MNKDKAMLLFAIIIFGLFNLRLCHEIYKIRIPHSNTHELANIQNSDRRMIESTVQCNEGCEHPNGPNHLKEFNRYQATSQI